MSSSDHSIHNKYKSVYVDEKYLLKGTKKIKIKNYLKCFVSNVSGLAGRYCNSMF
jgi:hypothetical protein